MWLEFRQVLPMSNALTQSDLLTFPLRTSFSFPANRVDVDLVVPAKLSGSDFRIVNLIFSHCTKVFSTSQLLPIPFNSTKVEAPQKLLPLFRSKENSGIEFQYN